jgi:hypothetical protein
MLRHLLLATTLLSVACVAPVDEAQTPTASRRPLARPSSVVAGERRWFVLRSVDLGLRDANAWKEIGFDLDRRTTTSDDSKDSRNSCKRATGSPLRSLTDGVDGIDNAFGQHVMSVIKSIKSDAEQVANDEIANGGYTLLLRIDGASAADNASAPGALYAAGAHAGKPTFTADDKWPVWSTTLSDGVDLEKPLRKFPLGYVRNGTWVSGEIGEGPEPIWFPLFGPLEMNMSTLLSVDLASGKGTLAGALPSTELVRMGTRWAGKFGMCKGEPGFDSVMSMLEGMSDLVLAAPDLQDPSRPCNAVSVGIGFQLAPVAPPTTVIAPPPAAESICP